MLRRQRIKPAVLLALAVLLAAFANDAAQAQDRWPPWQSYGEAEQSARARQRQRGAKPSQAEIESSKKQAEQLRQAGKYPEATAAAQKALRLTERRYGPNSPEAAAALTSLADIFAAQNRYADAEPLLKRALAIHEKAKKPDDGAVAQALDTLGSLYMKQGRTADAAPLLQRSADLRANAQAKPPVDTTTVLDGEAPEVGTSAPEQPPPGKTTTYQHKAKPAPDTDEAAAPAEAPPAADASEEGAAGATTPEAIPEDAPRAPETMEPPPVAAAPSPIPDPAIPTIAPPAPPPLTTMAPPVLPPPPPAAGAPPPATMAPQSAAPPQAEAEARARDEAEQQAKAAEAEAAEAAAKAIADSEQQASRAAEEEAKRGASAERAERPRLKAAPPPAAAPSAAKAPPSPPPAPKSPAPVTAPGPSAPSAPPVAAATAEEQKDWDVVPVFYGTDRAVEPNAQRLVFGSDRGRRLQLGEAMVTVPKVHQVPQVERPWALRIPYFDVTIYEQKEDPKRHFTIKEIKALTKEELLALVKERLKPSQRFKDQALVFVHGFNTSFDNALYRTGQIAYDLEFDGATFLYSWPSGGGVASYTYDRESAQASEPYLRQFLEMVVKETGAKSVSVIAHSMGNQPLMDVLRDMKSAAPPGVAISQVILAAPDVDADNFANLAQAIKGLAKGVTLYASSNDRALIVSRNFWGSYRAGDVPANGPLVLPGVDTIDVTGASTDAFAINHSGYAENNKLLQDIGKLILNGLRPPDLRLSNLKRITTDKGDYWLYIKQP